MCRHRLASLQRLLQGRSASRRVQGDRDPSWRSGMTLTELLVVIAIMTMLLGLAVPLMKTGLDDRKTREAARELNTYATLAKAMAAEANRPVGLLLEPERLPAGTGPLFARQVFIVESPLPYSGDVVQALAAVNGVAGTATFDATSASLSSLVSVGDTIRFDYKGPLYNINNISGTAGSCTLTLSGSPAPPSGNFRYQILRQPMKAGVAPLELPEGVVIDLENSGFGFPVALPTTPVTYTGREFGTPASATSPYPTYPAGILFGPDGSVLGVRNQATQGLWTWPADTIHLLVGRLDQVGEEDAVATSTLGVAVTQNLTNPTNLWVSVGRQTGRLTTAVNAWSLLPAVGTPTFVASFTGARQDAQQGQAMGGR